MTSSHFKLLLAEGRETLKLAFPIVTSQVGQLLLGVIDTVMIGRLGVVPLGAASFSTSIFSIFLVFGFGISSCIAPMIAHADGAKKNNECGELLRHGIVYSFAFAILLAILVHILSGHLSLFNPSFEVVSLAKDYLIVMGWSMIPALIFHSLRQYCEALSRPSLPMVIMLGSVLLNAFLNWIWIFGKLGSPAYGLVGAAWATFTTRCAMLLVILFYVLKVQHFNSTLPRRWFAKLKAKTFRAMFHLGFPSALQTLFEVGVFCCAAVAMGWISTSALAAHQIAISVASMTFMVTLGLSFATGIRVSNALGRNDYISARRVGFGGIALGGIVMGYFGIIILILRAWLPYLFISDFKVIEIAKDLLFIGAFFQVFDGVQGVAVGALRGLHDVKIPTLITFAAYCVICLPMVYFLGFKTPMGAVGIWIGLSVGLVFAAAALTIRFHTITQNKILKLAQLGLNRMKNP